MGKTARWFRGLLGGGGGGGGKKDSKDSSKEKKKWSFVKSFRDKDRHQQQPPPQPPASVDERRGSHRERSSSSSTNTYFDDGGTDPNKHAIAVAAATAAVAEAAVAAAHAAAAVVKLTNSGRCTAAYVSENGIRRDVWAAVKIQSAFRGYLARRALKALKGLVKLQALVRGHIIRKKTADEMRCMQALVRAQSRARASRSRSHSSGIRHAPGPATPEKYERNVRSNSTRHDRCSPLKRNSSKPNSRDVFDWDKTRRMDDRSWDYYRDTKTKYGTTDDDKSDKILEIDPGKPPHLNNKQWNSSQSSQQAVVLDRLSFKDSPSKDSTTAQLSSSSPSSGEVQSSIRRRPPLDVDDEPFCTAENSPQFYSAASIPGSSSRKGPFTPTKSDCSRSFASVYSDHPNYMSNTESSKAKVRSQSAPKQRLEFEKSTSARRYNVNAFGDVRPSTAARRASTVQSSFTSKAYPGSGRLDRLGMPIQQYEFGGVYRNRY